MFGKVMWKFGSFYAPCAFSRPALGTFIRFEKQSILMLRRPWQNHRAPTIMVLSNFRKFKFSAPIFGRGATPAPGCLELWKPPKKLTHQVVLTTQLPTWNQNFLNISADTTLNLLYHSQFSSSHILRIKLLLSSYSFSLLSLSCQK